jgi:hypothetical protein
MAFLMYFVRCHADLSSVHEGLRMHSCTKTCPDTCMELLCSTHALSSCRQFVLVCFLPCHLVGMWHDATRAAPSEGARR